MKTNFEALAKRAERAGFKVEPHEDGTFTITLPEAEANLEEELSKRDYRRIAREIVAMLIQRDRAARQRVRNYTRRAAEHVDQNVAMQMSYAENEAHNAAEIARRILYGVPR